MTKKKTPSPTHDSLVQADRIVVTPAEDSTLTLEESLMIFDPQKHGGEFPALKK